MLKKIFFFFLTAQIYAQTIPVGRPDFSEERFRNQQLISGAHNSFTIRPVSDSTVTGLLPASVLTSLNTFAPLGWNDGAMIPAKGLQTYLTAGFFAKYPVNHGLFLSTSSNFKKFQWDFFFENPVNHGTC